MGPPNGQPWGGGGVAPTDVLELAPDDVLSHRASEAMVAARVQRAEERRQSQGANMVIKTMSVYAVLRVRPMVRVLRMPLTVRANKKVTTLRPSTV